jgi:hypothetical protein
VLGGSFGEGIDLPGARLIGAFVATLGLPQMNPVNEQLRQRMQAMFGAGYDYTYLYPGLQKVVQAAGRVIRTERPRHGHLIDDRFGRPELRLTLAPSPPFRLSSPRLREYPYSRMFHNATPRKFAPGKCHTACYCHRFQAWRRACLGLSVGPRCAEANYFARLVQPGSAARYRPRGR